MTPEWLVANGLAVNRKCNVPTCTRERLVRGQTRFALCEQCVLALFTRKRPLDRGEIMTMSGPTVGSSQRSFGAERMVL